MSRTHDIATVQLALLLELALEIDPSWGAAEVLDLIREKGHIIANKQDQENGNK